MGLNHQKISTQKNSSWSDALITYEGIFDRWEKSGKSVYGTAVTRYLNLCESQNQRWRTWYIRLSN